MVTVNSETTTTVATGNVPPPQQAPAHHESRPETPKSSLTPQCVGREFVRQYYTLLGGVPELMHRFYSNESVMLRGSDDQPTVGQMDISKKFSKLGIIDCYTRVKTVHSSETLAKGVVVQVIGEMSTNGAAMRPFVQTFVLAPQSEKKYYVHSDIFQYLDALPQPNGTANREEEAPVADAAPPTHPEPAPPQGGPPEKAMMDQAAISNGVAHTEDIQQQRVSSVPAQTDYQHYQGTMQPMAQRVIPGSVVNEAASSSTQASSFTTNVTETWANMNVNTVPCMPVPPMAVNQPPCVVRGGGEGETGGQPPAGVVAVQPLAPERSESTDKLSSHSEEHADTNESGPTTWAGVAKKPVRSGHPTAPPIVPPAGPVTVPMMSNNQAPSKPDSFKQPPPSNRPAAGSNMPPRMSNMGPPRMPRQNYVDNFPNDQQIFVGNLPADITPEELHKCFSEYGTVLEVRIRPKDYAASYRQYPACAFVVFSSAQTALKVQEVGDVCVREKHKVNIEPKKPSEDIRSMRGGGRGGLGGHRFDQDRGAFPGGRGGGGGMGGGRGGGPGGRNPPRGPPGRGGRTIYPTGRSQLAQQQQHPTALPPTAQQQHQHSQ